MTYREKLLKERNEIISSLRVFTRDFVAMLRRAASEFDISSVEHNKAIQRIAQQCATFEIEVQQSRRYLTKAREENAQLHNELEKMRTCHLHSEDTSTSNRPVNQPDGCANGGANMIETATTDRAPSFRESFQQQRQASKQQRGPAHRHAHEHSKTVTSPAHTLLAEQSDAMVVNRSSSAAAVQWLQQQSNTESISTRACTTQSLDSFVPIPAGTPVDDISISRSSYQQLHQLVQLPTQKNDKETQTMTPQTPALAIQYSPLVEKTNVAVNTDTLILLTSATTLSPSRPHRAGIRAETEVVQPQVLTSSNKRGMSFRRKAFSSSRNSGLSSCMIGDTKIEEEAQHCDHQNSVDSFTRSQSITAKIDSLHTAAAATVATSLSPPLHTAKACLNQDDRTKNWNRRAAASDHSEHQRASLEQLASSIPDPSKSLAQSTCRASMSSRVLKAKALEPSLELRTASTDIGTSTTAIEIQTDPEIIVLRRLMTEADKEQQRQISSLKSTFECRIAALQEQHERHLAVKEEERAWLQSKFASQLASKDQLAALIVHDYQDQRRKDLELLEAEATTKFLRQTETREADILSMFEQHKATLKLLERKQEVEVTSLKQEHERIMQTATTNWQQQLHSQQQDHAIELEHVKLDHQLALQRLTSEHQQVIEELNRLHKQEVADIVGDHTQRNHASAEQYRELTQKLHTTFELKEAELKKQIEDLTRTARQDRSSRSQAIHAEIRALRSAFDVQLQQQENLFVTRLENQQKTHDQALKALEERHERQLQRQQTTHENTLSSLRVQTQQQIENAANEHMAALHRQQQQYERQLESAKAELTTLTSAHVEEVTRWRQQVQQVKDQSDSERLEDYQKLETLRSNELRETATTLNAQLKTMQMQEQLRQTEIRQDHERQIQTMLTAHSNEMKTLQHSYEQMLRQSKEDFDCQIVNLRREVDREKDLLAATASQRVDAAKQQLVHELSELQSQHKKLELDKERLDQINHELNDEVTTHRVLLQEFRANVEHLEAELHAFQANKSISHKSVATDTQDLDGQSAEAPAADRTSAAVPIQNSPSMTHTASTSSRRLTSRNATWALLSDAAAERFTSYAGSTDFAAKSRIFISPKTVPAAAVSKEMNTTRCLGNQSMMSVRSQSGAAAPVGILTTNHAIQLHKAASPPTSQCLPRTNQATSANALPLLPAESGFGGHLEHTDRKIRSTIPRSPQCLDQGLSLMDPPASSNRGHHAATTTSSGSSSRSNQPALGNVSLMDELLKAKNSPHGMYTTNTRVNNKDGRLLTCKHWETVNDFGQLRARTYSPQRLANLPSMAAGTKNSIDFEVHHQAAGLPSTETPCRTQRDLLMAASRNPDGFLGDASEMERLGEETQSAYEQHVSRTMSSGIIDVSRILSRSQRSDLSQASAE